MSNYTARVRAQRIRYLLFNVSAQIAFVFATWFVILTAHVHLSSTAAITTFGAFSLIGGIGEPASGLIADRWGRRRCLFAYGILSFLGYVLVAIPSTPVVGIAGFLLLAVGLAICSGSYEALIVDNFRAWAVPEQEQVTQKLFSEGHGVNFVIRGVVSLAAGYLFELNHALPAMCGMCSALLSVAVAIWEAEEPYQRNTKRVLPQLFGAVQSIIFITPVRRAFLIYAWSSLLAAYAWNLFQPILLPRGASPAVLGVVFGGLSLAGGIGNLLQSKFSAAITMRRILLLTTIFTIAANISLHFAPLSVAYVLLLISGTFWPMMWVTQMNTVANHTPAHNRASAISLLSSVEWCIGGLVCAVVGRLVA